jgi:hypothetical protein
MLRGRAKCTALLTIVDRSDDDEDGTEPRGNYQRIGECRELEPQKFFTTLQCIEDKACVMDDPTVPERVKHRMQVASQYCAGVASCTVPPSQPMPNRDWI